MPSTRNPHSLLGRRRELRREETPQEKSLWRLIRNRQFLGLKFYRQYGIGPYIVDFFCPAIRLAIELDGSQHFEQSALDQDEARTRFLASLKVDVVRFSNREINENLEGVIEFLEEIVVEKRGVPSITL
ncbi:MAG: endonuclease domain-containing protein [Acidobacteria bacterium]|nr:endonuclease domain-containing protein [Acidobacteriota bacterium]